MPQVILFSFTAMANPTLVAVTTLMLLLPNPKRLMLGYLIGALFTSITVGIVIALAFQKSSLVETGKSTINPAIDLTFGALLIALSVVLHTGRDKPVRERRAERKARKGPKKPPRWQRVLSKGDPKIAVVIGALLTLPGASYLAALDSIAKLSYSDAVTVLLVLMVNVIMLALLEVPLICFAVAPEWTPTMIERVKDAFRRRGRHVLTVGLAVVGSLIALRGLITIFS